MVILKSKVGPKGQVVIPKLLRDRFNILPGDEVMLDESQDHIAIKKSTKNILDVIAKMKKTKFRYNKDEYYEQIEEKWKRVPHT